MLSGNQILDLFLAIEKRSKNAWEKIHRHGIIRLSKLINMTSIYGKEIFNRKKSHGDNYKIISFLYIITNEVNFKGEINIQISIV